jgi:hypothetical protein
MCPFFTGFRASRSLLGLAAYPAVLWLCTGSAAASKNVASAREGAVAIADSELGRYTAGSAIDGSLVPPKLKSDPNPWQSGVGHPHPHWAWIRFRQPARIDRVVIHRASAENYPIEMIGEITADEGVSFQPLFTMSGAQLASNQTIEKRFAPVIADNFRLRILRSSNQKEADAAQLSEIEVFGEFARAPAPSAKPVLPATSILAPSVSTNELKITSTGAEIEFRSPWLRISFSKNAPQITAVCWDSLGEGKVTENLLKPGPEAGLRLTQKPLFPATSSATLRSTSSPVLDHNVIRYHECLRSGLFAQWEIRVEPKRFAVVVTTTSISSTAIREPFALNFAFDASKTPVAPLVHPANGATATHSECIPPPVLPCLLHAPDYGTLLVRSESPTNPVCVVSEPGLRSSTRCNLLFRSDMPPRVEDGLFLQPGGEQRMELEFSVEAPVPLPELVPQEPHLHSLARSWLNTFQYRADVGILANNIFSDNAAFCMFTFTDPAVFTPALPGGLEAIQLARGSLERYFSGARGCGIGAEDIETDVYPSLLISAWDVIRVTGDLDLLRRWLPHLETMAAKAEAQDRNGNGLPESTRSGLAGTAERPTGNWWDLINFGHEDAYVCALSFRAFEALADLEKLAKRPDQAAHFHERAERIRSAYVPAFLNPKTGILAGWRDTRGDLHDYWFVFINGMAISYGLVPDELANSIVERIEAKLNETRYSRFDLGLPGNLISIARADYIPNALGSPQKADGSDTFGTFENGGATACYAYFYIQALYKLGRRAEAERILWPMVETFARGGFQNGVGHGGEWRRWDGTPSGYEGFLADAYYAQLAVFTGHYGIGFGPDGFHLQTWSPLKTNSVPLGLKYMGARVDKL